MSSSTSDREQKLALARKKLERFQTNRNPARTAAAIIQTPIPVEPIPQQPVTNTGTIQQQPVTNTGTIPRQQVNNTGSISQQEQPIINAGSIPQQPPLIVNTSQTEAISLLIDEKQELLDIQGQLSITLTR
jgi:hypothetical protein